MIKFNIYNIYQSGKILMNYANKMLKDFYENLFVDLLERIIDTIGGELSFIIFFSIYIISIAFTSRNEIKLYKKGEITFKEIIIKHKFILGTWIVILLMLTMMFIFSISEM